MRQTIGVIGLGYDGLSLSLSFCEKEYRVIGVDLDVRKVEEIKSALAHVHESTVEKSLTSLLHRYLQIGRFCPTTRPAVAAWEGNAYIVTVSIPLMASGPDYRPFESVLRKLGNVIKPNDLVVIRSMLEPGTMEQKVIPILEQHSRLIAGLDFHLAYTTKRAGSRSLQQQSLEVVLGGVTGTCSEVARNLLGTLVNGTIHITDMETAQTV